MPEPVWIDAVAFDTSRPAQRPARAPKVRTSAPKAERKPKAPKPSAGFKKWDRPSDPTQRLGHTVLAELLRRVDAAEAEGLIDFAPDDEPVDAVCITMGEFALLMRVLMPEEYVRPERPVSEPTGTPPGTLARLDVYRQRAARGEQLYHANDATAHKAHDRGLRMEQRGNGTGVKVIGWADEGEADGDE
jgi:hypothetical protein